MHLYFLYFRQKFLTRSVAVVVIGQGNHYRQNHIICAHDNHTIGSAGKIIPSRPSPPKVLTILLVRCENIYRCI